MPTAQITVPLDIPDVRVLSTQINEHGEFIITVESTLTGTQCHRCGREIRKFHGYDAWVTVRHLPILGRPVYLRYRPKRYRCETCAGKPTTTQQLSWHEPNSPQTTWLFGNCRDRWHLVASLILSVVAEELPYTTSGGEQAFATAIPNEPTTLYDTHLLLQLVNSTVEDVGVKEDLPYDGVLGVLGLDEIALKKGNRSGGTTTTAWGSCYAWHIL